MNRDHVPSCVFAMAFNFAFGCGTVDHHAPAVSNDRPREHRTLSVDEARNQTVIGERLVLHLRNGETLQFDRKGSSTVRLLTHGDEFFVDHGIYTSVQRMIPVADVGSVEVDRIVYLAPRVVRESGRNAVTMQVATSLFVSGSLTVHYERILSDHVSISAGIGLAGLGAPGGGSAEGSGYGVELMAHFFAGDGPSKFEFAAGLAAVVVERGDAGFLWINGRGGSTPWWVAPSAFVGYRLQPDRGVFFKIGLGWSLGYGLPLGIAFGAVF